MSKSLKLEIVVLVLIPLLYFASCSVISNHHDRGFAKVRLGDQESQVIAAMGEPSDRETAGEAGHTHGEAACSVPCVQRLWYLNNLSLAGEAWFVDLGESGRVMHTAHLVSP